MSSTMQLILPRRLPLKISQFFNTSLLVIHNLVAKSYV